MKAPTLEDLISKLAEARGFLEDVESDLEAFRTDAYEEGRDTGYEEGYDEGYDAGVGGAEARQEDSK